MSRAELMSWGELTIEVERYQLDHSIYLKKSTVHVMYTVNICIKTTSEMKHAFRSLHMLMKISKVSKNTQMSGILIT